MINLYRKNETNFKHNQFVLNECKSCDVTEEINGNYEVSLEYPFIDSKDITKEFVNEAIIKLPSYDDREPQLFVIRRAKPNMENNIVTCYAQAIAIVRLDNNVVVSANISNKTRKQATQQILSSTINTHKFIVGNRDTNTKINSLEITNKQALEALKGENNDNSVLNTYGGELVLDNFTIDFVDQRGKDNGVEVTYAKNITGAELTLEDINKITEIIPVGSNGIMLPEKSVKADNFDINNPFTKVIEFSDISVVEAEYDENGNCTNAGEACTIDQAREKLRQACNDKFKNEKINETSFNLTLNLIELADCINFEGNDYSEIQNKRIAIGDTIKVNIKPLNINLKGRVYKLTRDAITGRLKSCEIGYSKSNILKTINKTNKKVDKNKKDTDEKIDTTKKDLKDDIEDANQKTDNLKVILQAKDSEIEASVTNEIENRKTSITILDGKIDARVKSVDFEAYQTITDREIAERVSKGADFYAELLIHPDAIIQTIQSATNNKTILNSDGFRVVRGGFYFEDNNGDEILSAYAGGGVRIGDSSWSIQECKSKVYIGGKQLTSYFSLSGIMIDSELKMEGNNIYTYGTVYTVDLEASGSKNCVQDTESYGKRLINAYETCDYYFGDIGSGVIENGECLVSIDPVFQDCINTDIEYHVFTQVYNGSITRIERYKNYFIVYGEENTQFSWELKAKRRGFEKSRLEMSKN